MTLKNCSNNWIAGKLPKENNISSLAELLGIFLCFFKMRREETGGKVRLPNSIMTNIKELNGKI